MNTTICFLDLLQGLAISGNGIASDKSSQGPKIIEGSMNLPKLDDRFLRRRHGVRRGCRRA